MKKRFRVRFKTILEDTIIYLFLIIFSLFFLIGLFFLLSASFKADSELFRKPFRWLPDQIQFDNYRRVFTQIPFFLYLKNTMIIVLFNILGSLISCSLVAYGFSRLRWKGRDKLFVIVILTMILPSQVTMVSHFLMFSQMKWIGTFLPLIVPVFFGNPFFIFLLRQFFVSVPLDITYAGRVDGANEFRIFWQLTLPVVKPALTTVAIFAFTNSWNDFLGPLVYLGDDKLYTLSLAASMLRSNLDPNWSLLLTLGVIMVLPVLILFFVLQKYFIQGIAMSGIKE